MQMIFLFQYFNTAIVLTVVNSEIYPDLYTDWYTDVGSTIVLFGACFGIYTSHNLRYSSLDGVIKDCATAVVKKRSVRRHFRNT